jgi:PAS domain S-box-containing protein
LREDHQSLLQEFSAVQQALSELAAIYNDAPIGLAVIGTDFRYQRINARLAEMNGVPVEAHLGRTMREVVPELADIAEALVRQVAETGKPVVNHEMEGATAAEPGVTRSFTEHWTPIFGPDGRVVAVNIVVEEITARKRAEERLRSNERRLATALRAGNLGVFEYLFRPAPSYYWDSTVRRIWGAGEDEAITHDHYWNSLHPADAPRVMGIFDSILTQGEPRRVDLEYRIFRLSDKGLRWVRVALDIASDASGPVSMIGTAQDITDRKSVEENTRLLMREVNHRSKNLLAVVQSIAHQMARNSDPQHFAEGFSERLSGLASCQDLLVNSQWKGVDLKALITSQLPHYTSLVGDRLHLVGPAVRIAASAAQNLGMALHELATNAAKYGALSNDSGKVAIAWNVTGPEDDRRFALSWFESDGPPVTQPARQGLGSYIVTRLLKHSLNAEVTLDYASEGLRWTVSAPAKSVLEEPPHAAGS